MNHVLLELNCYFEVVKSSFHSEPEDHKLRHDLIEKCPDQPAHYTINYVIHSQNVLYFGLRWPEFCPHFHCRECIFLSHLVVQLTPGPIRAQHISVLLSARAPRP